MYMKCLRQQTTLWMFFRDSHQLTTMLATQVLGLTQVTKDCLRFPFKDIKTTILIRGLNPTWTNRISNFRISLLKKCSCSYTRNQWIKSIRSRSWMTLACSMLMRSTHSCTRSLMWRISTSGQMGHLFSINLSIIKASSSLMSSLALSLQINLLPQGKPSLPIN